MTKIEKIQEIIREFENGSDEITYDEILRAIEDICTSEGIFEGDD